MASVGGDCHFRERIDAHLDHLEEVLLSLVYRWRVPGDLASIARHLRVVTPTFLADVLDDVTDDGLLTETERATLVLADLVLTGRCRETGQDLYLLVELATRVGVGDVERAVERAMLLQKLGRPVLPVVAGDQIADDAASRARAHGVWAAIEGQVTPPLPA